MKKIIFLLVALCAIPADATQRSDCKKFTKKNYNVKSNNYSELPPNPNHSKTRFIKGNTYSEARKRWNERKKIQKNGNENFCAGVCSHIDN